MVQYICINYGGVNDANKLKLELIEQKRIKFKGNIYH